MRAAYRFQGCCHSPLSTHAHTHTNILSLLTSLHACNHICTHTRTTTENTGTTQWGHWIWSFVDHFYFFFLFWFVSSRTLFYYYWIFLLRISNKLYYRERKRRTDREKQWTKINCLQSLALNEQMFAQVWSRESVNIINAIQLAHKYTFRWDGTRRNGYGEVCLSVC